MGGIDTIIAEQFRNNISIQLGSATTKKIEQILQTDYNITFEESMNEFDKFLSVIKKIFGSGYKGFLKNVLKDICTIQVNNNKIIVHDDKIVKNLLEIIGDEDNRKILDLLISRSLTTSEIITKMDLPSTSIYRRIEGLMRVGFLVEIGKEPIDFGRPSTKLTTVYCQYDVKAIKNKIIIAIKLSKNMMKKSSILHELYCVS